MFCKEYVTVYYVFHIRNIHISDTALGFHGYSIITLTILQSVISVSVDMLPLPGGMGISESLYLVMFAPVFGEALLPAMLLSRGISYYAQMLISAVMTCVAYFIIGRKEQEEK